MPTLQLQHYLKLKKLTNVLEYFLCTIMNEKNKIKNCVSEGNEWKHVVVCEGDIISSTKGLNDVIIAFYYST